MRRLCVLLAIANLGQAPAMKGGTVTGTISVDEAGRPMKPANVDVWVYLASSTAKPNNSVGKNVVAKIAQTSREFVVEGSASPHVAILPIGGSVYFPNLDHNPHSVFSPGVEKNRWMGFDLDRYGTDKVGKHKRFLQVGEFDIYCDIHPDMEAKVKVVPTRYFAKVVDGKYSISDVVPGVYKVIAWSPTSLNESPSLQFEVTDDQLTYKIESVNVHYDRTTSTSHTRSDGSPYDDECRRYPERCK